MGKADTEASSKVKNLFAIDWNVNPQAFIKKVQLDVEVSKKDMTELVALEDFTIFCKPGVGLFGSAEKKNIPALMEFILKFHETYGVPFFNDKGKPRITASTGLPPSIARALGFTKGEDKWEYVPTEEDGGKEETTKPDADEAKKKASKKDKKATAKTEKPKEKEKNSTPAIPTLTPAGASTISTSSSRRDAITTSFKAALNKLAAAPAGTAPVLWIR
jgi:hypothetical protein